MPCGRPPFKWLVERPVRRRGGRLPQCIYKHYNYYKLAMLVCIGVWQGVAMDSLKFHPSLPCPTLYALRAGHPKNGLTDVFRGGSPAGQAVCGRLLPLKTPARRTPMRLLVCKMNRLIAESTQRQEASQLLLRHRLRQRRFA
jgi:hypothetical protein